MSSGAETPLGARLALWGAREIVSLFLSSLVAGSATTLRHHPLRCLPLSSLGALRRACKPSRRDGGLGLGHADGHCQGAARTIGIRRHLLAADGLRPRLDDCGRAVGDQPAGRSREDNSLRGRTVASGGRGAGRALSLEVAAALRRRGLPCRRHLLGCRHPATRRARGAQMARPWRFAVQAAGWRCSNQAATVLLSSFGSPPMPMGARPRIRRSLTGFRATVAVALGGSPTALLSQSRKPIKRSKRIAGEPRS